MRVDKRQQRIRPPLTNETYSMLLSFTIREQTDKRAMARARECESEGITTMWSTMVCKICIVYLKKFALQSCQQYLHTFRTTLHSYYSVANIIYISLYYMYIFRGYPLFNLVREYLSQYSLQSYQAEQSAGHMEINVIFNNCCLIIIFIIYFLTGEGGGREAQFLC